MRRSLVILTIVFTAIWTARWWSGSQSIVRKVSPQLPVFSNQIDKVPVSKMPPREPAAKPIGEVPAPKTKRSLEGKGKESQTIGNIRQYLRNSLRQLETMGRDSIPTGKLTFDQTNSLGFRSTIEQTAEGDTVSRSFDANGFVMGEKWKKSSGEELVRTFRSDGNIEGVYFQRKDGSSSSVSWTPEGVLYSKKDELENGDMIYTLFDRSGFESQIWRKTKDGRSLRLDD